MCYWGEWRWGDDKQCAHARMMVMYSNNHSEKTAQVNGSATMMVTVVATQELKAGDVLRRFGAETAQDEPRRGNNNNRCIVVSLVVSGCGLEIVVTRGILFTCMLYFSSTFFSGARVCV